MKIALIGYGKMGRMIERLARARRHEVVLRIGRDNRAEMTSSRLRQAEVALEFTGPEAAFDNIVACVEAGVPVVSGSTGWLDRMDEVRRLVVQRKGSFFYASNFSRGMWLFMRTAEVLSGLMASQTGYRPEIEEVHHVHKKDAPSGTAIALAERVLLHLKRLQGWTTAEEANKLAVRSRREGEVPGTHVLRFVSPTDRIELEHVAHSREGFASGALDAAEWLRGRTGCFGMDDMLMGHGGPPDFSKK